MIVDRLMMEAVRTSETSVDNQFTRQYIPEDNSERSLETLCSHVTHRFITVFTKAYYQHPAKFESGPHRHSLLID
jgi:hypothetical protein